MREREREGGRGRERGQGRKSVCVREIDKFLVIER